MKSQFWIAVSFYGINAIAKKRLNRDASLYILFQVILFEKMPLQQAFSGNGYQISDGVPCNQLNLLAFNRTLVLHVTN